MVYGNSNSNDDDDGQWTMDIDIMVIFLLSTWRSILNNSSDNNISSINAKRLDLFILLEDCNGALSLVVIFVGVIVIVGWSLMAEPLLQMQIMLWKWRESIVIMIDPALCVRMIGLDDIRPLLGRSWRVYHITTSKGLDLSKWATYLVSEYDRSTG